MNNLSSTAESGRLQKPTSGCDCDVLGSTCMSVLYFDYFNLSFSPTLILPVKMPEIIDDKSEHCIPFILERIQLHREQYQTKNETPPPFFLGLNGVQGAGKTTLVGLVLFL